MLSLWEVHYHVRLTSVYYVKSTKKSWKGSAPPYLAMPIFWERLFTQPFPNQHHFHSFTLGRWNLFFSWMVMWSVCIEQHNEKTLLKGIKGFTVITQREIGQKRTQWKVMPMDRYDRLDDEDEGAKDFDVDLVISSKTKIKEFQKFKLCCILRKIRRWKKLGNKLKKAIYLWPASDPPVLILNNGQELMIRKQQISSQGDRNLFIQKVANTARHPYHDKREEELDKYFSQNLPALNSLRKSKGWRLMHKAEFYVTGLRISDDMFEKIFSHCEMISSHQWKVEKLHFHSDRQSNFAEKTPEYRFQCLLPNDIGKDDPVNPFWMRLHLSDLFNIRFPWIAK